MLFTRDTQKTHKDPEIEYQRMEKYILGNEKETRKEMNVISGGAWDADGMRSKHNGKRNKKRKEGHIEVRKNLDFTT